MNFKFFSDNEDGPIMTSIKFLNEFARRLDYKFIRHHRIFSVDHIYSPRAAHIFSSTINFIAERHLTNHHEVIRYMTITYRDMTDDYYVVSDIELNEIIVDTYHFIITRNNEL